MKTRLLFVAFMAIGLSSCSITEDLDNDKNQELNPINFANGRVVGSTKALDKTSTWEGDEIVGIFAMKTDAAIDNTPFAATFANNLKLTNTDNSANGSWDTESALYWPATETEKITFFAYHPYSIATGKPVVKEDGTIDITHTVEGTPADQTDLLWAWVTDAHKDDMDGNGDKTDATSVPFAFKHALTKISFKAMTSIPAADATIKIKNLSITATNSGTATLTRPSNISWAAAATSTSFTVINDSNMSKFIVQKAGVAKEINDYVDQTHSLLMIPQTLTSNHIINLTYTVKPLPNGLPFDVTKTFPLTTTETWNENKHVIYNFNIALEEITFTATTGDWAPVSTEEL